MGSSRWSDDFYTAREADRAATGKSAFAYHAAMSSLPTSARKVHEIGRASCRERV